MSEPATATASDASEESVPDPQVCREFGISAMTLWRWDHDHTLSFPPPIRIRNRKFRSRRQLEETKARMLRDAMVAKASTMLSPGRAPSMSSSLNYRP
jgi:predicted DNA-binding transcriptional regulator AlpA